MERTLTGVLGLAVVRVKLGGGGAACLHVLGDIVCHVVVMGADPSCRKPHLTKEQRTPPDHTHSLVPSGHTTVFDECIVQLALAASSKLDVKTLSMQDLT